MITKLKIVQWLDCNLAEFIQDAINVATANSLPVSAAESLTVVSFKWNSVIFLLTVID